jgi:hypothetical protein
MSVCRLGTTVREPASTAHIENIATSYDFSSLHHKIFGFEIIVLDVSHTHSLARSVQHPPKLTVEPLASIQGVLNVDVREVVYKCLCTEVSVTRLGRASTRPRISLEYA